MVPESGGIGICHLDCHSERGPTNISTRFRAGLDACVHQLFKITSSVLEANAAAKNEHFSVKSLPVRRESCHHLLYRAAPSPRCGVVDPENIVTHH